MLLYRFVFWEESHLKHWTCDGRGKMCVCPSFDFSFFSFFNHFFTYLYRHKGDNGHSWSLVHGQKSNLFLFCILSPISHGIILSQFLDIAWEFYLLVPQHILDCNSWNTASYYCFCFLPRGRCWLVGSLSCLFFFTFSSLTIFLSMVVLGYPPEQMIY